MKISMGNEIIELSLEKTMSTLLRLQNLNKFMNDIFLYFENNDLYDNMEEAKSMGLKVDKIVDNLEWCLIYGKLLTDELCLIEINYNEDFINNFELKINEQHLIQGAGFVLRYLGFSSKYCNSVSDTSLYETSADIYSLWESNFKRKLYLPIYYPERNDRKIIGYDNTAGWGSSKPIYSNEGWW